MLKVINETAAFIKSRIKDQAKIGIILGSGLNNVANEMVVTISIPYAEIPNFPVSTVVGHKGMLLFGKLNGINVMAMQGRFHFYEGYDMKQITFPIRIMKALGVETLVLSNAAGGMNPNYNLGDIILVEDHINFFPEHPLRGKNDDSLGPRFPDMSEVYDKQIILKTEKIANKHNIQLKKGVYLGVSGPTFETPAEYRMFYRMGGDCVGMSTVPEAIVAHHSGMKCICFSVITDVWRENHLQKVTHEEVLEQALKAEPILAKLLKELVLII